MHQKLDPISLISYSKLSMKIMNISKISELASPKAIKQRYPLSTQLETFIDLSRKSLIRILEGEDTRFLLIVGPCSIHNPTAALSYAQKLKQLADEVSAQFHVVMRVHTEKPRTLLGWKGFLYDPYLDGSNAMDEGLLFTRQLLL